MDARTKAIQETARIQVETDLVFNKGEIGCQESADQKPRDTQSGRTEYPTAPYRTELPIALK
jgi:hypothetical protein